MTIFGGGHPCCSEIQAMKIYSHHTVVCFANGLVISIDLIVGVFIHLLLDHLFADLVGYAESGWDCMT